MTKTCHSPKLQRFGRSPTTSYIAQQTLTSHEPKILCMPKKTGYGDTSKLANTQQLWQTEKQQLPQQLSSSNRKISTINNLTRYGNKARVIATKKHKATSQPTTNIVYRWFKQDKTLVSGIKPASLVDSKHIQAFFATDAYQTFDETHTPNTTQAHLANQDKQPAHPKKKSKLEFFSNPFKGEDATANVKASQENGTLAADLIDTTAKEPLFDNENFEASTSANTNDNLEKKLQEDLRKDHEKIIEHTYGQINLTKSSSILKIMYRDISSTLLFKGLLFIAILITAFFKIYVTYQATQETILYSKLLADQTSLQHSNQNLQLEFLALTSRSKITDLALKNLSLIPIKNQDEVIVIVPFTKVYLQQQQQDSTTTTLPLLNFPTPRNQ